MASSSGKGKGKGRRGGPLVVSATRGPQRFLRGMITHDLVQRGLGFDDAYAVARAVRDRVAQHEEVTTSELRDLIQAELERIFGAVPSVLAVSREKRPRLRVLYHGEERPFSRGLLAQSVHAAGVDLDRAYRVVTELEGLLSSEGVAEVSSTEVAERVGSLLEQLEGVETARRYRLMRRVRRLPQPLVVYVGGASGTGKSSLALELAPLLRVYRVTATDTVRQVMRMVFTPAILPALHRSTFELPGAEVSHRIEEQRGIIHGEDDARRLIASYEEQATRVCVGVRAVVERAAAENLSLLVEGVHLFPQLVPFPDLDEAAYQVSLVLATLDPEAHRARFVSRSLLNRRRADRYLGGFDAIRLIHEHILEHAEARDVPWRDTSFSESQVDWSLRVITGWLERRLPGRLEERLRPEPTLLFVLDGVGDRRSESLEGRTPLEAARMPNLDRLARKGQLGLADPLEPGVTGDTAAGCLALLGQSPRSLSRGPIEAAGAGLEVMPGDVALRGNLATLDKGAHIIDRRAGRIREGAEELAAALDGLPLPKPYGDVTVRVRPGTEHRLAIVLAGPNLSPHIVGSDPGGGLEPDAQPVEPHAVDGYDDAAVRTAGALAAFEAEARKVLSGHEVNETREQAGELPANCVLTRSPGVRHQLVPLEANEEPLTVACVAGDRTVLGLARWLGADCITAPAMTASLDTDLDAKLHAARGALEGHHLVVVHVKGTDIAAHDRNPDQKARFLERFDEALGRFLEAPQDGLRIIVAADHGTSSELGIHVDDPVPVLIWGPGFDADAAERYTEIEAARGSLGRFPLVTLLGRVFELA